MKSIETYRTCNKEGKALYPKFGGMELPQLIDFLANAYGHLNSINPGKLDIPTRHRITFSMDYLRTALRQLDIQIEDYKM